MVELFHLGRLLNADVGRGARCPVGVAEPSLEGTDNVEVLADTGLRANWPVGAGSNDCLRLAGLEKCVSLLADRDFTVLALAVELPGPLLDIITDDGGEV